MAVNGVNGTSGSQVGPVTDPSGRPQAPGSSGSALPEGTPLPPIQGGGLIHAASAEIPGDTPGSTVTPNKFGNPMEDYENVTQQIKDAETALEVMEEKLEGYEADVEKYTDELGKAIEELDEANEKLEELSESKADLEQALEALKKKTNPTDKEKQKITDGEALLKKLQTTIATATTAVEEAKKKVEAKENDIKTAKTNQKNKEKDIEDKEELIKQLEAQQKDSEEFGPNGDLDGDGVENHLDPDIDGDGLSNTIEGLLGLNPFSVDSDNDGVKDSGEIILSLKATDNDDLTKKLKALMEKAGKGEDPFAGLDFNPLKADSNGDGIIDKLQVPEQFPKQWASFIYTSGAASGTAGTSSGKDTSAEASAVNWAPPSEAGSKKILTYNNENADGTPKFPEYGKDGVFEIPFSTEDKILTLSPFDDEVLLEKTGNDLVITIKSTKDGVTKENKLTYKDYFVEDGKPDAGKATFKLYVFDIADANGKQGIETLEFKGFDPGKIDTFNGYGTHTGGLYLSTGEEATKGAGWEKFKAATKIENTKKPQNPFDNKALKLEAKDENGVPTITLKKTDIYSGQVGNLKTTTFNFPSEYEGKKLDKWKATTKIDDQENPTDLILEAIDKDGKVIVRYKLVGMAKAAIGTDKNYALNFQMANGGQFVDFMEVNGYVTVDGGDGDDVIKLKAGKVNANAGDDLVIAGDGIDNAQAPSGLNKSPTGKLGVEVHGGDGDDWIFGGSAYDQIYGDKGWDYLDSGGGMAKLDNGKPVELDQLFGGDGNDVLIVHDPKGLYTVDGGAEADGTNAINFVNQNYQDTIENGVWDLNGYLSYLQDKWGEESGMTLAEIKKANDEGVLTSEFLSAQFKKLAQNIATVKKAEKEAKFDGTAGEKKDEKKT